MSDKNPLLLADPWQIKAANFPEEGTGADKLLFLLNYAVLAPSILNVQPWRFRVEADAVLLYRDHSRLLPVVDPDARQLTISCGAALLNLRVAAQGFGLGMEVDILPEAHDPDLLAKAKLAETAVQPSDLDLQLRDIIPSRRTNRKGFADQDLGQTLLRSLVRAAREEGGALAFLPGESEKRKTADIIAEAELVHRADPAFRAELANWIRNRLVEAHAGDEAHWRLSGGASGHTPDLSSHDDLFIQTAADAGRTFTSADSAAAYQHALAEGSPVLALLSTHSDSEEDWLKAGQTLQRSLLTAARAGVSASYLNPPIELANLRPRLARVFGVRARPQVLLRLGYGPEVPPAPRRPVNDVVVV